MASNDEVEQDLSHIHWSWPEAIAANPARSLANADLAMDYFAYSPFWDSKSNNNVLRTQRRVENPTYGHAEEKIELNAFKSGFEYIISHSQPPDLFVIQKREVESSGKRDIVSGSWFILHDKIYQSPTVYEVASNRLRNAAHLISKTLSALSENRPPSNPRSTTIWRSVPPSISTATKVSTATPTDQPTAGPVATTEETTAQGDGDGASAGEKANDAHEEKEEKAEFDWHLFHALQSTRSALPTLDELASQPIPPRDPLAELRNIEAVIATQFSAFGGPGNGAGRGACGQRPNSLRSNSLTLSGPRRNMVADTPGTTTMGLNIGMGVGQSPMSAGGLGGGSGLTPSFMGMASSPRVIGLANGSSPGPGIAPSIGGRATSIAAPSPMNTSAWNGQS